MAQYSMETAMSAESRGTPMPTAGKTNKMHQRDPRTTVKGGKYWDHQRISKTRVWSSGSSM